MESGNAMERDGVWIPLTPGKPALTSEQGTGKENINAEFPFTDSIHTVRYTEMCVMNETCDLPAGILDEYEVVLGVAGKDPKSTRVVQDDTSCVQEETVKNFPFECESKNKQARGFDKSQDSIGSVPTPSKTKESRKRHNDGNDMNKKLSQRPRVKKHRPKVFDDSKPKKVLKAQTPRARTLRSKTPKPATPSQVQERKTKSRKNKFTESTICMQKSSSSTNEDVQDVQEASRASMIVVKSCKRILDFDHYPVDKEFHHALKSHKEPLRLGFEPGKFDCFGGKIVTSKRNTPRRSKFQKKSLKACDYLLGDNNKQQHEQDISVTRNQEQVDTNGRKYVNFYQRRKKVGSNTTNPIPTLQVYRRRSFRGNECLHYSKKCGPNFPKLFKKQRTMRKKVTIKVNQCKILVKRSHRKFTRTTRKKVQNKVNKSKDKKEVVKPDLYTEEWRLRVFSPLRRKRSKMHIRLKENSANFPYNSEKYLLCHGENFLQITEGFPLHVVKSQSLPTEHQDVLHAKEHLNDSNVSPMMEYLTGKIASLDISDQCQELVVRDQNVSGALVKIIPTKKRKMLPKVNLDTETVRVWKLLMENDGSEPVEETDKDKEEWWETQRSIFRGRVDSFIAKMHLIQGNRRFSPWKGSVTDSVVGVYLTQNVSDHFSSSAFMSVAARFPANVSSEVVNGRFEFPNSEESVSSNTKIFKGFTKISDTEQDICTSIADVRDAIPATVPNQDKNNNFRKLLEVEEMDYLKQFCSVGIEELDSSLNESKLDGEEKNISFFNFPTSNEPSGTTFHLNASLCEISESEFVSQQKSTLEEEPQVVTLICSLQSEVTIEQGVYSVNNHPTLNKTPLETKNMGKKKNKNEKKQEPETDWEELRRSYCKNGEKETNENYKDAVDWDAVRRATVAEIAEIIVDRGMNNVIAGRIKDFLDRMYKDHGTLDLEWLRDVPPDKAKEFLLSIQGLGLKSVECVRLLTLHHNAFPVDTNVGRVATRLGWVPLQPLPDQVQIHLLNAYPMVDTIQKYLYPRLCTLDQKTLYELHYQLITFGKVFCTKLKPNCNACPMRAECRHYASEFASGRLALPGTKESNNVTSIVPAGKDENHGQPSSSFDLEVNNPGSSYQSQSQTCEPIIEVPPSPEPEIEPIIGDIEDLCCESDDEIPTIILSTQEFRETLKDTLDTNNISLPEADVSKALVAISAEAANMRVPRKKFVVKSRTMHLVYELPDFHPCLGGFEEREHDDPTPYLLAIWFQGEIPNSLEYTQNRACIAASNNLEETVKATVLIPCRTANRGRFPLNGTYFQVNEVFADDETSHFPIDVPRSQLCNLPLRELGCGSSATSIFKALSTGAIQRLFWRGSICVRGFNRKTRQPRSLHKKFHISTTAIAAENRKLGKR